MNWYKLSKYTPPIQLLGFQIYKPELVGDLIVLYEGVRREVIHGVDQRDYYYIRDLLGHKNFSTAGKKLYELKQKEKDKDLTPRGYTPDEEEQMMDQLFDGKDQQLLF